jgi:hypothetical protein
MNASTYNLRQERQVGDLIEVMCSSVDKMLKCFECFLIGRPKAARISHFSLVNNGYDMGKLSIVFYSSVYDFYFCF